MICGPTQVYVSANHVRGYTTKNGKKVSGYFRNESCRISPFKFNDFKFENQPSWYSKEKFKEWDEEKIKLILSLGGRLPELLRRVEFTLLFHAEKSKFPNNPAMSIPQLKAIVFYDKFFKSRDTLRIFGHEISHLLYWKLTDNQKIDFALKSGWRIKGEKKEPPQNPIYEDSALSPAEDFANNVEALYFDRKRLEKNNPALINYFLEIEKDVI